jgi:hypothetical protein
LEHLSKNKKGEQRAYFFDLKYDGFVKSVTPLKNGVQEFPRSLETLDSGFRRNDGKEAFSTFYERIKYVRFFYACQMR